MVVPDGSQSCNASRLTSRHLPCCSTRTWYWSQQRGTDMLGSVRTIRQVFDDGRLIVADGGGNPSVDPALGSAWRTRRSANGQRVIVDPSGRLALELLPDENDADLVLEEVPDVTFADIGGLDSQIERIRDAVQLPFLHRSLYERYNLKAPKGVLLYGPPGNGKTHDRQGRRARACRMVSAGAAACSCRSRGRSCSTSSWVNPSVWCVMIFTRARERAADGRPVIVFIDEMDSLLRTRGTGVSSPTWRPRSCRSSCPSWTAWRALDNVMVIGASNRVDMIDPAVLRPGRLDVKIRVDRPGADPGRRSDHSPLSDRRAAAVSPDVDADGADRACWCSDIYAQVVAIGTCATSCDDQGQWSAGVPRRRGVRRGAQEHRRPRQDEGGEGCPFSAATDCGD